MALPVQLAPGSLALVLARRAAGRAGEPAGRAVFRAFRRANARCSGDAGLARAASRLAFGGWLRRGVLLVSAPPACLRALRRAWRRGALRPPRGFCIRAVGDVFPVQMNAIAQFIPLDEVLCCAISDMNANQIVVTQESLLEHLMKHYPGIAIPSQDILYSTLGSLIKQKKIYHTGEGYFIMTPQTYFITNTTAQENKRVLLSGESHLVPASLTYLVNVESCAESPKENTAPVSHCQSCQCFSNVCTQDFEETPIAAEATRKGQKGLEEFTPLIQNQVVSASEEKHIRDSPKSLPYTKDKEKSKKFGFSLLWRSISRKKKPKTEHSSFSAQFPPQEWPVRDEDNLDNIPRDVEHEIIKRDNPILTVDSLIKHTVLMQKCEEQKKYNSQGTSTDMLTSRHKYPTKEGVKKRQGWSAKPQRWGRSHRHRRKAQSWGSELQPGSVRLEKHPKLPVPQASPRIKSSNETQVQKLLGKTPTILDSHLIYKKQISNPFQGLSLRGNPITKRYNKQTNDLKPNWTGTKEKPFQKSRSSDSSRTFDGKTEQLCTEHCYDKLKTQSIRMTKSSVQPVSNAFRDGLLKYSQCSILPKNSQCFSFRGSILRSDVYGEENKVIHAVWRKSHSHVDKLGEAKEAQHILPSQGSSSLDLTSSVGKSVDKTTYQFQNLGLLDYPFGVNHLKQPERQDRDSKKILKKEFVPEEEIASLENEGLSDNDQAFYQEVVEEENGACSSLYLEEDDFSENDGFCQMLPGHIQYSFIGGNKWNHLGRSQVTERLLTDYNSKIDRLEPLILKRNDCYNPTELLTNPSESQKPNLSAEICGLNSGTQSDFNYKEESSVAKCVQASAPAEGRFFDYCSARKPNSEAEILQDSVGDTRKKPVSWGQSPQNQEMGKHFTQKFELFNSPHTPVLAQAIQQEHNHLEGTENHSMAGDSGIDSPWTQSLASNNSAILDGLKKRQDFLQNFEGTKKNQTRASNFLLQLTPVINV